MSEIDEIVGFEEPQDQVNQDAYDVIGAAIAVHKELGPGHAESVYENALAIELELRGIPFERQRSYELFYKGRPVGTGKLDFLIRGNLVVEIKAVSDLAPIHTSQTIAYCKATVCKLGLLLNFNVVRIKDGGVKRFACGK